MTARQLAEFLNQLPEEQKDLPVACFQPYTWKGATYWCDNEISRVRLINGQLMRTHASESEKEPHLSLSTS